MTYPVPGTRKSSEVDVTFMALRPDGYLEVAELRKRAAASCRSRNKCDAIKTLESARRDTRPR
jgi:hypothetical protein